MLYFSKMFVKMETTTLTYNNIKKWQTIGANSVWDCGGGKGAENIILSNKL